MNLKQMSKFFVLFALVALFSGCAEGPFWKAGAYLPWVQAKWRAEEQIAETIHAKRAKFRDLARSANQLSEPEKDQAVAQIMQSLDANRIDQLRVDAAYALGELNIQSAENALIKLLEDSESEVRMAAVEALSLRGTSSAGQELIRLVRSESDDDVRSAALRNLAKYPGDATVMVLAEILEEPKPALQYVACKSLAKVTNQEIGLSVPKWKSYLASKGIQPRNVASQDLQGSPGF